ncbi:MAG: hypothetical protein LAO19_02155 [Acidobacteriia bacterium]|nr:hypothetical protein [Terriglobia bacterium]
MRDQSFGGDGAACKERADGLEDDLVFRFRKNMASVTFDYRYAFLTGSQLIAQRAKELEVLLHPMILFQPENRKEQFFTA